MKKTRNPSTGRFTATPIDLATRGWCPNPNCGAQLWEGPITAAEFPLRCECDEDVDYSKAIT